MVDGHHFVPVITKVGDMRVQTLIGNTMLKVAGVRVRKSGSCGQV